MFFRLHMSIVRGNQTRIFIPKRSDVEHDSLIRLQLTTHVDPRKVKVSQFIVQQRKQLQWLQPASIRRPKPEQRFQVYTRQKS